MTPPAPRPPLFDSLQTLLDRGVFTSRGAVLRALLPQWKLSSPGYGTGLQRMLALALQERAEEIAALPRDELVAAFAAGGRSALYELCVAAREVEIAEVLARWDVADEANDARAAEMNANIALLEKNSAGTFTRYTMIGPLKVAAFAAALAEVCDQSSA